MSDSWNVSKKLEISPVICDLALRITMTWMTENLHQQLIRTHSESMTEEEIWDLLPQNWWHKDRSVNTEDMKLPRHLLSSSLLPALLDQLQVTLWRTSSVTIDLNRLNELKSCFKLPVVDERQKHCCASDHSGQSLTASALEEQLLIRNWLMWLLFKLAIELCAFQKWQLWSKVSYTFSCPYV